MALNTSGPISLGGTTTGQSIAVELGGAGTSQISLNDTNVRSLAGVSSGTIIVPTNFYGKSSFNGFTAATAYTTSASAAASLVYNTSAGRFVSMGSNAASYSTDGINWTTSATGFSPVLQNTFALEVNESAGRYVVLSSQGGFQKVFTYSDNGGVSWSALSNMPIPSGANQIDTFGGLVYSVPLNLWVSLAFGNTIGGYASILFYSSNGTSWTSSVPASLNPSQTSIFAPYGMCVRSSGAILACGSSLNSSTGTGVMKYTSSTDGINWATPITPTITGLTASSTLFSAIKELSNGNWLIGGNTFNPTRKAFFASSSNNGTSWGNLTTFPNYYTLPIGYDGSVAVDPASGRIVAMLYFFDTVTSSYSPYYTTSTNNGVTWSAPTAITETTTKTTLQSVCVNSTGRFVALGGSQNFANSTYSAYSI
jgi:hypothetical protein